MYIYIHIIMGVMGSYWVIISHGYWYVDMCIQWQQLGRHRAVDGLKPRIIFIFRKSLPFISYVRDLTYDLVSSNLSWVMVEPAPPIWKSIGTPFKNNQHQGSEMIGTELGTLYSMPTQFSVATQWSLHASIVATPWHMGWPVIQSRQLLFGKGASKRSKHHKFTKDLDGLSTPSIGSKRACSG